MKYDVIVIGTGQAGVPLATRFAGVGKRVLIAEASQLGGTCINTGCTPTKTMIASARTAHVARRAERLGVRVGEVHVDLAAVVARKNDIVGQWRDGVARRLAGAGENLTLVRGRARFVAPREIEVNNERHSADTVIINTGGRPAVPPVPGLDTVPWLDNASLLDVTELPRHLVVLGGGYIGCELGQMMSRFGAPVTIIESGEHLLGREDSDVSEVLEQVFVDEGMTLELGRHATSVRMTDQGVVVELDDGRSVAGSHLLVATGRRPNTDDLGCDAAGVELDARGYVIADDEYRTTAEGVYAVGDVLGAYPQFTHASWDDHRILFDLLQGTATRRRSDRLIPHAVFTDPQIGHVGLSERAAAERGVPVEVASMPMSYVSRALEIDEPAGLLKVLTDPEQVRILGATVVGIEAGELIHVFAVLMEAGASPRAIIDAEFVHPALAEGIQSVVMQLPAYAT